MLTPKDYEKLNQFYEENQRLMNTNKLYTLEELLDSYHPFPWGNMDMMKEVSVFNTGKKYENGENIYRYRRHDDAENY